MDSIHKAYITKNFPNEQVFSGAQFLPLNPNLDNEIMKIINLLGAGLFPLSLAMMLPVFIYNIVLEKE